ncbi:MAG: tol-pal system protein YbgF [Venatoribacter sp.]
MKPLVLTLALAMAAGASAQEWVSVGAAKAAPKTSSNTQDSSSLAFMADAPSPSSNQSGNALVAEMAAQIEQLQQEVAMLQGRLEEQEHQIQRMQTDQQQRYLDLDNRLSVLFTNPPTAAPSDSSTPAVVVNQAEQTALESPDDAYQSAMALVREKKYDEASDAFDNFVVNYPNHSLVANALYWSGEVWLVKGGLDKALAQFKRVTTDFADQPKAADATYKVGVTLHRQGKTEEAKVWLNKVIQNFSGKADGTVRLAKSYLEKL